MPTATTETQSHHYSFSSVVEQNHFFQHDRPLMEWLNTYSVEPVLASLCEEIGELNGKGKDGIFSRDKYREDYRQQEAADIALFAINTYEALQIEPNYEYIWARTRVLMASWDIAEVPPQQETGMVPLFDDGAEDGPQQKVYEQIKWRLNQEASKIKRLSGQERSEVVDQALIQRLEEILALTSTLFYLIGLHPVEAIREKVARNMLKYPAYLFSQEMLDLAKDQKTGEIDTHVAVTIFKAQSEKGKTLFDGERDADGKRPLTGTEDFYGEYERLEQEADTYTDADWQIPAQAVLGVAAAS